MLEGENTIYWPTAPSAFNFGIHASSKDLTVIGSSRGLGGTLSIDAPSDHGAGIWHESESEPGSTLKTGVTTLKDISKFTTKNGYVSVYSQGDISIENTSLDSTIVGEAAATTYANVYSKGNLSIKDCKQIKISNNCMPGLDSEKGFTTINNSKIDIDCEKNSAIWSNINADSSIDKLTIENSSEITATSAGSYAVYSGSGLIVDNSILNATSDVSYGAFTYGDVAIKNSAEATFKGDSQALRCTGGILIDSSTVNATSQNVAGLYSGGSIDVSRSNIKAVSVLGNAIESAGVVTFSNTSAQVTAPEGKSAFVVSVAGEETTPRIVLEYNLKTMEAAKIATAYDSADGKTYTSFISGEDDVLETDLSNALNEVNIDIPFALVVAGGQGSGYFLDGERPTITATAPTGKEFKEWKITSTDSEFTTEGLTLTDNPLTFTMPTGNTTATATFTDKEYTNTTDPAENGTVALSPTDPKPKYNDTVTITLSPKNGYKANKPTVTDENGNSLKVTGSENQYTFTQPDSNVNVTATFTAIPYTLTVNGGSGSGTFNIGDEVTITALVPIGKEFDQWSITSDDTSFSTSELDLTQAEVTFTIPAGDVTATAVLTDSTFTSEVKTGKNCSATVSPTEAKYGDTVTITVTPDKDTIFNSVKVTDANGDTVEVTAGENNTFTFAQPASNVVVEAVYDKDPAVLFTDVDTFDWFYGAVTYAVNNGLMVGTSADEFTPTAPVTRAQIWMVLAREDGADVEDADPWSGKARIWAMEKDVSDGTDPDAVITREQLITMFWRYSGSPKAEGDLTRFKDANQISDWAEDAMAWGVENEILKGKGGGLLDPKGSTLRSELATVLQRYLTD